MTKTVVNLQPYIYMSKNSKEPIIRETSNLNPL